MGLAQREVEKLFPWDIQLSVRCTVTLFCGTVFYYVKLFGIFFRCEWLFKQKLWGQLTQVNKSTESQVDKDAVLPTCALFPQRFHKYPVLLILATLIY
jgi:hypothetical protein